MVGRQMEDDVDSNPQSPKRARSTTDLVFTETFPYARLKYIVDHYDELMANDPAKDEVHPYVIGLFEKCTPDDSGMASITFRYAKSKTHGLGRVYARPYLSAGGLHRPIRHTLFGDSYWDADFNATASRCTAYILEMRGLPNANLQYYIDNRSDLDETLGPDSKRLVNRAIHGSRPPRGSPAWLTGLYQECMTLANDIKDGAEDSEIDKEIWEAAVASAAKKERPGSNVEGSAISIAWQIVEDQCLMTLLDYLRSVGLDPRVLCYDGIMGRGTPPTPEQILAAERLITETHGITLPIKIKPMDQGFTIPPPETLNRLATLGRHIRNLNKTWEELTQDGLELVKEHKTATGEEQDPAFFAVINFIRRYIVFVNDMTLVPVTNDRGVIIKYQHIKGGLAGHKGLMAALAPYIRKCGHLFHGYTRLVTTFFNDISTHVFNEFCGYQVEQLHTITDLEYDEAVIRPALDHLHSLCSSNDEEFEHFLDFAADMFQFPHERPTHMHIFHGPQGSGRSNFMIRAFCNLLGMDDPSANRGRGSSALAHVMQDETRLFSKFNGANADKLLTLLDDIGENGSLVTFANFLKGWITTAVVEIEKKGQELESHNEYSRLIGLTNHKEIVELEDPKQRRMVIHTVMGDILSPEELQALYRTMDTPRFQINWFKFLMARDISNYNRYNPVLPVSVLMRELITISTPPIIKFFIQRFIEDGSQLWHCLDRQCRDIHHREGQVCRSKNLPQSLDVIGAAVDVIAIPRCAMRAEYNRFLDSIDEYRAMRTPEQRKRLSWETQGRLHDIYKLGLIRGKGDSCRHWFKIIRGQTIQVQGRTTGDVPNGIFSPRTAPTVETVTITREIPTSDEVSKEYIRCFEIPPPGAIKEILIKRGYLGPDE